MRSEKNIEILRQIALYFLREIENVKFVNCNLLTSRSKAHPNLGPTNLYFFFEGMATLILGPK